MKIELLSCTCLGHEAALFKTWSYMSLLIMARLQRAKGYEKKESSMLTLKERVKTVAA